LRSWLEPREDDAMLTTTRTPGERRSRIAPSLLVFVIAAGTVSVVAVLAYRVGRQTDSDLRFLEPRRAPTFDEATIALPIEYALRSSEKNDVIFVGDSCCRTGIDPLDFERLSGLRAYNLGSIGKVGPMGFFLTAKAYLSRHPAPQLLVLCMTPFAFHGGAFETGGELPSRFEANYAPEVPGVLPTIQSMGFFAKRGAVSAWSASWALTSAADPDVRSIPLFGIHSDNYWTLQQKLRESRGYWGLPGSRGADIQPGWPGEPVKVHEEWDRAMRLLAETCESAGVPLLIRFMPVTKAWIQMKDYHLVEKWARDFQLAYPHVVAGRPILLFYESNLCWDGIHLNRDGVAAYMPVLAKEICSVLNAAPPRAN
jgi:hypothetical protein